MLTLRVIQHAESQPDHYRIEVTLEGDRTRHTALANFEFKVKEQEQENIRWYLEDFLQYSQDPAPEIADKIEQRMVEIGVELFEKVFEANDDSRQLWEESDYHISDTRMEIITGVRDAAFIPWELIRTPQSHMPLALLVGAFVRTTLQAVQRPQIPQNADDKIRILLVICRPKGGNDVPFRSVATKLIKGLTDSGSEVFQLEILRPPTFKQLEDKLRQAKAVGQPYHIVHFDGHGVYEDKDAKYSGAPPKPHKMRGYLLFENPAYKDKQELVDGKKLGELLTETGVSLLVLNACRSAYVEMPAEPGKTSADKKTRAFGSLAQEVMDAGVAGIVAMRYNVYVLTAAQFVADLYAALAQGQTLGKAVTQGRQQLHAQPVREIAYKPLELQDWTVPVVYEAIPMTFFPPKSAGILKKPFNLSQVDTMPAPGMLDPQLPKSPEVGFFGRDETLLALDRAFDTQHIVLLHADAGSGKTSTVVEFGRWYALTSNVKGLVLFTSFERYLPLKQVLDKIGQVFGNWLEERGVHWLALNDSERWDKALEVLREVVVLWIWDNVEPVAGFPTGTESAWSAAEKQELVDFLQEAGETKAKLLLASRRDEQGWLGDLPRRITMPPMPMQERVQLARAIAEKRRHQLTEVKDWRPLLRFTEGNPLTITVLVGQAIRDGLRTKEQVEDFVTQLRVGEATIEDDEREGRSKSLGASLSYGFENAFSEAERQQLALLHFFRGFVNVDALRVMGICSADWCVPAMRGLTWEAGIALLDRAAEVGLLTSFGCGFYTIHPVLPWYFKKLFDQYYPPEADNTSKSAMRAFVEAQGDLGDYYTWEYEGGKRGALKVLRYEEANLLHARHLAGINGWWPRVTSTMQGLRILYEETGRWLEWARLVEKIVPDFVDPATDGSLPGREEQWYLITGYRVQFAIQARQWAEAERLLRVCEDWIRQRVAPALAVTSEALTSSQRDAIHTLAVWLTNLGKIQLQQGNPDCVSAFEEAFTLMHRIDNQTYEAGAAFNLGDAYLHIPVLCDLMQAEDWYQRSLQLHDKRDHLGQAKCWIALGNVSDEQLRKAQMAGQPKEDHLRHFKSAEQRYQRAFSLMPSNAVEDLAKVQTLLGNICIQKGDIAHALSHYREAIRYDEASGNLYNAAGTRLNIAVSLKQSNRFEEALLYAQTALGNYEAYGDRAAEKIQRTQGLITEIEGKRKAIGG